MDARTVLNWERKRPKPGHPAHPEAIRVPRLLPLDCGDRFRQVPVGLGLTQKAAAAILGVDPATVTRWETGERRPLAGYRERLLALRAPRRSR